MKIREVNENKKQFISLLLLADEQESMVERYLEKGTMYVLEDNDEKAECVVTDEGNGISNPVVAGIVYWLIRILICGGCLVGAGILVAFIEIKIAELYKKCCWDMITIMVILISMATAIYFGKWIKTTLPINLLFLLLFVQLVYVGIRWYVKGWRETRGYH